jgi:predicted PurR-regulated permease PerM
VRLVLSGALTGDRFPPDTPPDQEAGGVRRMVLFHKGLYTSLGVLVTAAAAGAVYLARDVLIRALIAVFLAISLDTIVRMLTRWGMPRGLAVFVVLLVMVVSVAAFLSAVIPTMIEQFHTLAKHLPAYVADWQNRSTGLRRSLTGPPDRSDPQRAQTVLRDRQARCAVLAHAILAYVFGVVTVAGAVNLISNLLL